MSQAQMDQTIGNNYLSIGWNILNNIAYISFDIGWIRVQFRASSNNYVACRMKYGNNSWSSWKNIYS